MRQLSSLNLSQEDLFACNMCRIYLRALYLSDITSGDGLEISEAALLGIRDGTFRADSWPFCPKPSPHKWIIWRKCLGSAFCTRGRRLRTSLGSWVNQDPEWPWYCNAEKSRLYEHRNNTWKVYQLHINRHRIPVFQQIGQPCDSPDIPIFRAMAYKYNSKLLCNGSAPIASPVSLIQSFQDYLMQPDAVWCTKNIQHLESSTLVVKALIEGTAIAISDGSYKDSFGTAAWTIQTETGEGMSGQVIAPGHNGDHSSYRSELAGLFSIAFIIYKLCSFYHVQEGSIQVRCDGLSPPYSRFLGHW